MADIVSVDRRGEIAVVTVDSPPVNALGIAVRKPLAEALASLCPDATIKAIIFTCGGRTFFAGADIAEFGKPPVPPTLTDIFDRIESCGKLTVAAIHGQALGGGFELALLCNHRVAVPSARFALPEVGLGILPGLGGTQRLPRIVGARVALDLITSGRSIAAKEALELGVIDGIATEERLVDEAVAYAAARLAEGRPPVRVRDRDDRIAEARGDAALFETFLQNNARAWRGQKAQPAIVEAVRAAVELPFEEGLKQERRLFETLQASPESRALRHAFFAERQTAKVPGIAADTPVLPVGTAGVVGAGTMGGGIAMVFANAGIGVTLVETSREALDRGLSAIRKNYEASVKRGKLDAGQLEQRMAMITPTIDLAALGTVDLIIEAVFEEMAVKTELFAKLDRIARAGAILASNTSFLDLDAIAAATGRPGDVVGLHFFSPANVMRLLEVVRGRETSDRVVATAMRLARTLGKVPVLSGNCRGFIANRIMAQRRVQADQLVLEGPTPAVIDKVLVDYGFAMGPFQTADLVGLDVLVRGETERSLRGDLVRQGRLGQKTGGGFYDYDESRKASPSPVAQQLIADLAAHKGVARNEGQSDEDILLRLLLPVVNEGARLLEEGIALRASDIDVAAMLGFNWPAYRGGPMCWADQLGLDRVVDRLRALRTAHGDAFEPAPLLLRLAAEGRSFTGK
ncbi:3-hydroxyacyl-CoA dehydrogenase NAD-binding domain-containing protein [Rhizorhabdus dicambivorans]|uniref:3-hydroxyacyl-CoA dehydrogenase n=1 Tax=Rhizorhabdus dicambivorans TaxID=1850238 RepID=A0A2A4FP83_9SPHN|nr:3-hydroxyacyl-CoA dehydrogenase NAD-binding domain-containing protein [Rhizorhabdus dicambivorans]ATE64272.1 3-hydroxyacyl-CoA dehydrogenase [Rhizorhabdus dicambivorans]PCE40565.1 3-hydroxyacyl-CoA dehydrogenase [Rhizorhabdus dicambivorans]